MFLKCVFVFLFVVKCALSDCYWNRQCPYLLHSSKTPYDAVRGDIRDYHVINGCEAVSVWTLNRHGNRNPGSSVTVRVKAISLLKDDIIASFNDGTSQLCAQDIDLFKNWSWNDTLENTTSQLTEVGYKELFDLARRIREKYPQLVVATPTNDTYEFRPTNEQRTVMSATAFIHGLIDTTNHDLASEPLERDDTIRTYENCERYQAEVRRSSLIEEQIDAFLATPAYKAIQNSVQNRLGISYALTPEEVYDIYELCRFDRSWNENLQSPWCAVFDNEDLAIIEYRDDVRHYYRNGYGHWTNTRLGGPVLHNLYNTFMSVYQGGSRKLTSFFTHDTMVEMTFATLGLFKDNYVITGDNYKESRLWRSSYIGALSTNIIAVMNRCNIDTEDPYRIQLFINEKETELCPTSGCTWAKFQELFQNFSDDLSFCNMDYVLSEDVTGVSNGFRFSAMDIRKQLGITLLLFVARLLW